jgi:hypothetical protein
MFIIIIGEFLNVAVNCRVALAPVKFDVPLMTGQAFAPDGFMTYCTHQSRPAISTAVDSKSISEIECFDRKD